MQKELFKGLYIYDSGYEFVKHPVIRIGFNSGDFSSKSGFHRTLLALLEKNQRALRLECPKEDDPSFRAASASG